MVIAAKNGMETAEKEDGRYPIKKGGGMKKAIVLFSANFWTFDKKMPYSYARG